MFSQLGWNADIWMLSPINLLVTLEKEMCISCNTFVKTSESTFKLYEITKLDPISDS